MFDDDDELGFYSLRDAIRITTLSRSTILRGVEGGTFPPPCHISAGRIGWPKPVLQGWVASKSGPPGQDRRPR
jgi:predicted DNA-binding transcriptional regulator AlpA|nr:AlpA family phage regulatory protein [Neorhizobium tomejilense]